MSPATKTDPAARPLRRLLLALGASVPGERAAAAAARLASDIRAEIRALFVEETALLRVAELPFAREIDYRSGLELPLESGAVRGALAGLAAEARRRLEAATGRVGVRFSFDVVRGEPGPSVAAAALEGGADLVFVHGAGPPRATSGDSIAFLLDTTEPLARPLLVVTRALERVRRALVAVPDPADAPALIAAATELLGAAAVDLLVLSGEERRAERIERETREAAPPGLVGGVATRVAAATGERLAAVARMTGCDALVVSLRELRRENVSPSAAAALVACPVLVVP